MGVLRKALNAVMQIVNERDIHVVWNSNSQVATQGGKQWVDIRNKRSDTLFQGGTCSHEVVSSHPHQQAVMHTWCAVWVQTEHMRVIQVHRIKRYVHILIKYTLFIPIDPFIWPYFEYIWNPLYNILPEFTSYLP